MKKIAILYQPMFYVRVCVPTFISASFPTKILCIFTFCEYVVTYEQNVQNHEMKCVMKIT